MLRPREQAVFEHLESRLGEMCDANRYPVDGLEAVDLLRFPGSPRPGATTYATFGLNRAALARGREDVRIELLMRVAGEPEPFSVPDDDDDAVVLLELVPVAASEASYVGSEGWAAFVELAERRGADLHDLRRPALVDGAA
jgi:hypothetical protein